MTEDTMLNAKEEILDHIEDKDVEFVRVLYRESYKELRIDGEINDCANLLDFLYDSGHGCQKLFGFILYKDGTWSEREEYDGSERWEHRVPPTINTELGILGDL